ncbi:MAG: NDP-sugar synthase [Vicinamibacterales bacterium]|nr:NDP-sugar synthase [Vicinamibacterales bacterium]
MTPAALHDWPALVLAAGLATRLQPLSRVRAKAALPVAGRTVIERTLRWLHAAGVRRVVINLHHRAETITRLVGDGRAFGLAVRYSWEDPVLGSAGGPRRALPLLDRARFLIVNGDTLTDVDLAALAAQHVARRALVTMAVVPGDTARYGGVQADAADQVTGFVRATDSAASGPLAGPAPGHFIGVQAVEAAAFADAPDDTPSESVRWLYPRLIAARPGAVQVYRSHAAFFDIGTPRDYLETVRTFAAREACALDQGADTVVDPTARVTDSVLWDRVTVGPGAVLDGCIVTDDVVVPAGARHADAMLVGGPEGLDVRSLP